MSTVCAYDNTFSTRCMWAISTRFIHTYDTMIYEWWWESRLDLVQESRWDNLVVSYYEMCESRLENYDESRLDFYVRIPRNFRPVGWQLALLMLRSLSTHNLDTFYSEYLQIPDRLPNDIKHSFIFNKPFNNIKWGVFGIILYIFALCDSFVYLNGL